MGEILKVENIGISFGGIKAVNDVSISVEEGSITSVIGPNGSGKTTLFNLITGFYRANTGKVVFLGEDITSLQPHEYVQKGLTRTFQNVRVFPQLTVLENVIGGYQGVAKDTVFGTLFNTKKKREEEKNCREMAVNHLTEFGYADLLNQKVKNLPYGTQKKLEIVRSLASNPKLLLLDEPAAGLNSQESLELRDYIAMLRDRGHTILLIEHDMKLVMSISDYVYVMNQGQLLTSGTPEEVQRDQRVIDIYIGKRGQRNVTD